MMSAKLESGMPEFGVIDCHLHLLNHQMFTYPWVQNHPRLQQNFDWNQYASETRDVGLLGALFVEVDVSEHQMKKEIEYFGDFAKGCRNSLLGVVGACRPELPGFENYVDRVAHPALKGFRRIMHNQYNDLCAISSFRENIRVLGARGYTFDLCVTQQQLMSANELIVDCPNTIFVLDHFGNPDVLLNDAPFGPGWQQWKKSIEMMSKSQNLNCKISGIGFNGSHDEVVKRLRPYFETVITHFGWDRVIWGSDYPVCNLGCGLESWIKISREIVESETICNKQKLFCTNGKSIYCI
jgi:predicted TIM-barrel fold metal-dependent hydrolase